METRLGPCDSYLLRVTADFLPRFLNGDKDKDKERRFFGCETVGAAEIVFSTLRSVSPSVVAFKLESVSQAF